VSGSVAMPFGKRVELCRESCVLATRPTAIPHIRVDGSACSEWDIGEGEAARRL
jgi:hypothetical protein